jgi:hypothetical protein
MPIATARAVSPAKATAVGEDPRACCKAISELLMMSQIPIARHRQEVHIRYFIAFHSSLGFPAELFVCFRR